VIFISRAAEVQVETAAPPRPAVSGGRLDPRAAAPLDEHRQRGDEPDDG
jgi:hypothetical protein